MLATRTFPHAYVYYDSFAQFGQLSKPDSYPLFVRDVPVRGVRGVLELETSSHRFRYDYSLDPVVWFEIASRRIFRS